MHIFERSEGLYPGTPPFRRRENEMTQQKKEKAHLQVGWKQRMWCLIAK